MAVAIKLSLFGKRGYKTYRLVVMDKRINRDGRYLERIGIYNPNTNPATLTYDKDRLRYWLDRGAQVSAGVQKLLVKKLKA
ncbi:30S ribosomal protein S16 [Patescibacteria group bacterium]|nr:30S ribosomal protein S16 [Patescibacteria group bacterium]MCL5091870.1 30S ribosomal protein S16 [Patescibacteria group bacterium]